MLFRSEGEDPDLHLHQAVLHFPLIHLRILVLGLALCYPRILVLTLVVIVTDDLIWEPPIELWVCAPKTL